ncbi:membrane protein [Streptomyces laurentii]|uniref:Membrane protein n=1 Tax=Streptomyces laurentii TaxID=39478 RepID=A0A160NWZ2_STRLU|nr:membrane protein [Streptomyces laurentii]
MQHEQHTPHEHHNHHQGHDGHTAPMDHTDHTAHADHTGHTDHANHAGHAAHTGHSGHGPASWATAAQATLHCLTGCAIGEVLGMVIGTALGWGNLPTMVLAIILAFVFGYTLTMRGVLKAGLDFKSALPIALAADTVSIAVMEIIDNGFIVLWPGAMDATLSDALFWISLAASLALAFVITTPVNKWMIGRGKGHAVVHQFH